MAPGKRHAQEALLDVEEKQGILRKQIFPVWRAGARGFKCRRSEHFIGVIFCWVKVLVE
jgi:hypothetical protein